MIVNHAELVVSAVKPEQYPKGSLPEIALVGRSNVGKSSLINRMINRKRLAHTSSTPGKTQTLNFYLINRAFYFVDLPGYGYAKVSKQTKAQWGHMIEHYLRKREELKCALLLVDVRHKPTRDDVNMFDWLDYYTIPTVVVATKSDKLSKGKRLQQVKAIQRELGVRPEDIVAFSSATGEGKEPLWRAITSYVSNA